MLPEQLKKQSYTDVIDKLKLPLLKLKKPKNIYKKPFSIDFLPIKNPRLAIKPESNSNLVEPEKLPNGQPLKYLDYTRYLLYQARMAAVAQTAKQNSTPPELCYPDFTNYMKQQNNTESSTAVDDKKYKNDELCYADYTNFVLNNAAQTDKASINSAEDSLSPDKLCYPDFSLMPHHP